MNGVKIEFGEFFQDRLGSPRGKKRGDPKAPSHSLPMLWVLGAEKRHRDRGDKAETHEQGRRSPVQELLENSVLCERHDTHPEVGPRGSGADRYLNGVKIRGYLIVVKISLRRIDSRLDSVA
jgi:hypothetical protein